MSESEIGLVTRYEDRVMGQLRCWDRVVLSGTLPDVCHEGALMFQLLSKKIRCFDIAQYAEPLRDRVRENAEKLALENGLEIEFLRAKIRKEERVQEIVARRGSHPGLIHIFSVMEGSTVFKPWHDKKTGRTGLRSTKGQCLHYYFYWIHPTWGLCHVRVPTWLPFRLQFYFNGHSWLARKLDIEKIGYHMIDNAFDQIEDWQRAQEIADDFPIQALATDLKALSQICCPVCMDYPQPYYWSLFQVEYSWDVVFKSVKQLAPIYEGLSRQAITTVRAVDVCRFFGKRLPGGDETPVESRLNTRKEGLRIRHQLDNKASLKLYDKQARILRVEATTNDVTFFKHYRKVEHRDGTSCYKDAALKKSLFSLGDLRGLMQASCKRYWDFLSQLEDPSVGRVDLDKISRPVLDPQERSLKGFNLFLTEDYLIIQSLLRGEFQITGLSNKRLRKLLPHQSNSQIGRILRRLRFHGLIRKIGKTYKYYVTTLGQKLLIAAFKLKEHLLIPSLANT